MDLQLDGKRVVIIKLASKEEDIYPGLEGTVYYADSSGNMAVRWDNGSSLGLVKEDTWKLVEPNISFTL